jgi:hypothetical protein
MFALAAVASCTDSPTAARSETSRALNPRNLSYDYSWRDGDLLKAQTDYGEFVLDMAADELRYPDGRVIELDPESVAELGTDMIVHIDTDAAINAWEQYGGGPATWSQRQHVSSLEEKIRRDGRSRRETLEAARGREPAA